jgi:NTP pyrophosphatase (non-canonical NTP hydrolase)
METENSPPTSLRLDDLYKMVAHIYAEQNAHRPASATLSHFVEVCGMLTVHARSKKREGVSFMDSFCKALGWYFPLLAKFRVSSVEELVFRKYPNACPYCRLKPHQDYVCKTTRGTSSTVNHLALREEYEKNVSRRPSGISDWQSMFQQIYPRSIDDARAARSTLGLFEELGELAEAVRVFDRYPKYFAGEAADVFSYLMGLANEHMLVEQQTDKTFNLEDEFIKRYPGMCVQCGCLVCVCPLVPESTVGRMAKELDVSGADKLFHVEYDVFTQESREISSRVLKKLGGYTGLVEQFPFDRGDTNKALVLLCLRVADAAHATNSVIADGLRSTAIKIGASATYPGSRRPQAQVETLVNSVREMVKSLPPEIQSAVGASGKSLEEAVARAAIPRTNVLLVMSNPSKTARLDLGREERVIREAIKLGKARDSITIESRTAATADDLRRALLDAEFQILHFSGHGDLDSLLFTNELGKKAPTPIEAVESILRQHPSVRCLILNACDSMAILTTAIADFTIGMDSTVSDEGAIEFARGFYDAIAAGRSLEYAVNEGKACCELKNLTVPIKMLKR